MLSAEIETLQHCLFLYCQGKKQLIPLSLLHPVPPPSVAPGVGTLLLYVLAPCSVSGHSDRSSDCSQTLDISFW